MNAQVLYLRKMQRRLIATVNESNDSEHIMDEDMPKLKRVLIDAGVGIEKVKIPMNRPGGFGFVLQGEVSLLDNLCYPNMEFYELASIKIGEAIGAYRLKRNDTLNPIRWVIGIWHLPQSIAGSFGVNKYAWPIRIFQFIYQLAVVGGFVLKITDVWKKIFK